MQTRTAWATLVSLGCLASIGLAEESREEFPAAEQNQGRVTLKLIELEDGLVRRGPPATAAKILPKHPPLHVPASKELLPADAQALMGVFDGEADAIRQKAEQEIQVKRQTLIAALQALQDAYTRDAKLDEAVAIRDRIRQLTVANLKPLPDPGNLAAYVNRIGETFYFTVVGSTGASVWGSEVYTYDSHLATAAVHAGVLKSGQRGIVKVTMVKSPEAHRGSTQNGVTTSNWGPYSASYTVERVIPYGLPALKTTPATPHLNRVEF